MTRYKTASRIRELYFRKYLKFRFGIVDTSHANQFYALWHILKSHPLKSNYLIDIDASDGVSFSVVRPLLLLGWHGLLIENEKEPFKKLESLYVSNKSVNTLCEKVSPSNIDSILDKEKIAGIGFLNIDIDAYGLEIFRTFARRAIRPEIISPEINEKIPPPLYFEVQYSSEYMFNPHDYGGAFFGCSLQAVFETALEHNYEVIHLEYNNVFLIDRRYVQKDKMSFQNARELWLQGYVRQALRDSYFPWNSEYSHLFETTPADGLKFFEDKFESCPYQYILTLENGKSHELQ